jgi:hypothetical protein
MKNNHSRTTKNIKKLRLKSFCKRKLKALKTIKIVNIFFKNYYNLFSIRGSGGGGKKQKRNKFFYRMEEITKRKEPIVYYMRFKKQPLISKILWINKKQFKVVCKTNYTYYPRFGNFY